MIMEQALDSPQNPCFTRDMRTAMMDTDPDFNFSLPENLYRDTVGFESTHTPDGDEIDPTSEWVTGVAPRRVASNNWGSL